MQRLIAWLLGRRYWLLLLAIVFVQIFPVVTAALLVVDARARGLIESSKLAVPAMAGAVLLGLATGGEAGFLIPVTGLAMLGGLAMGSLLAWSRSLALAFQGTLLGLIGLVAMVALFAPSAATLVTPVLEELVELMRSGGATDQQLASIRDFDPALLMALMFAGVSVQVVAALLLGYWWYSLADATVKFGEEFRQLKLGRVLGFGSMVALLAGMVTEIALIDYLAAMAVIGFLIQGLAVLHAWSFAKRWNAALVGLIYVSLVTPLSGFTVFGLSAAGLVDNFFALRGPLKG
jgi:hypothetical protein